MAKAKLPIGRLWAPYILIALAGLIVGSLVGGTAGPVIFTIGAIFLGAFLPLAALYFFMQGYRGNV